MRRMELVGIMMERRREAATPCSLYGVVIRPDHVGSASGWCAGEQLRRVFPHIIIGAAASAAVEDGEPAVNRVADARPRNEILRQRDRLQEHGCQIRRQWLAGMLAQPVAQSTQLHAGKARHLVVAGRGRACHPHRPAKVRRIVL